MSPTHVEEHGPFFFSQRRNRRFQRRLRKTLDDTSVFGEKRDPLQALRADGESVVSARVTVPAAVASLLEAPISPKHRSSSGKRVALSEKVVVLPPLDPNGPKLISGDRQPSEAAETKPYTNEKFIKSLLEEAKPRPGSGRGKIKELYRFNELKFGSTSILSNLSKVLYPGFSDYVSLPEDIPVEFVNRFLQDHQSLTADVVVEKREWQTDCYLDVSLQNEQPFLTGVPGEQEERIKTEQVVASVARRRNREEKRKDILKPQNKPKQLQKRVTMSREVMSNWRSSKRPQTARSVLSNLSFHSDYSQESSAEDGDEYDILPPELRPSILLYRRETQTPKMKVKGPKTRLEKFRSQASKGDQSRLKRGPKRLPRSHTLPSEGSTEKMQDSRAKAHPPLVRAQTALQSRLLSQQQQTQLVTINFSVGSSEFEEKGWLVHPTAAEDPEMATLLLWDRKTKERVRQREEEKMIAKQQGADGPLVVKFYSDPHTRSLRSKHQRSATFPLPTVLSKLPPSVASFTTPGVASGDAMMIGEGPQLAVLVHPDGSGHANYYSSSSGHVRQAVCQSRMDADSRGLYTVVYDDTETHGILACFSPSGRGWSYYPGSGALQMYYDRQGGRMYNEDGHVTKKWVWPPANQKLPVSLSVQFNSCLTFHCTNLSTMVLRFSCRGQQYRFDVSPPITSSVGSRVPAVQDNTGGVSLQSGLQFTSNAATVPSISCPSPDQKGTLRQRKRNRSIGEVVSRTRFDSSLSVEDEVFLSEGYDLERMGRELATYKERIKNTTNEWMAHYRKELGISLPSHPRSSSSSTRSPSPHISRSSSARQLHSSLTYTGEVFHSRPASRPHFHTHPLPSRVNTPLEIRVQSPDLSPTSSTRASSPTAPHAATLHDHVRRPASGEKSRQIRVGPTKPHKKASVQSSKRGCPVALHNMMLRHLDTMPPCKCDKRKPPYLCDLEYDVFLNSHVPSDQVVVVCVLSSLMENSCPCEPMLDALHYSLNRLRFFPCTQCSGDTFRVVKYDLSHSLIGTKRSTPLLVERHGAGPGMFLMYVGGRLVHADYVFNGYGTTKKDFMKQVQKCSEDARKGHYLPSDYRFTSHNGAKVLDSTSWAYPLCGVLGFLVPYSPSSASAASLAGSGGNRRPSQQTGGAGISKDLLSTIDLEASSQLSVASALSSAYRET